MRGDAGAESEAEAADPGSLVRRPCLEELQSVLREVSGSPFHQQQILPVAAPGPIESSSSPTFAMEGVEVAALNDVIAPLPAPRRPKVTPAPDLVAPPSLTEEGAEPCRPGNPFRPAPPPRYDLFGPVSTGPGVTPRPLAAERRSLSMETPDLFSTPPTNDLFTPSPNVVSTPDLFKAAPSDGVPRQVVLTTPGGTESGILHPTPAGPGHASDDDPPAASTFRRPPRPLPRVRRNRKGSPAAPPPPPTEPQPVLTDAPNKPTPKPLPRPVLKPKPKTPDPKKLEPENFAVFEDILLIGEECCVDDWPDDSPELDPGFRPSGKLRLRRESMKVKEESDRWSGDDQDDAGSGGKRKDRKFQMSFLSRGSKDKFLEQQRSRTASISSKSSKDVFPEGSENEDGDQSGTEGKRTPLKARVSWLLRRGSSSVSASAGERGGRPRSKEEEEPRSHTLPRAARAVTASPDCYGADDCKPKKAMKTRTKPAGLRSFGTAGRHRRPPGWMTPPPLEEVQYPYGPPGGAAAFAEDEDEELKPRGPAPLPRKMKMAAAEASGASCQAAACSGVGDEYQGSACGSDLQACQEMIDSEGEESDDAESCGHDSEEKKKSRVKGFKKNRVKRKAQGGGAEEPPGATSSDYMSEAAEAEWAAAQTDRRAAARLEDGDDDGDTDSLMEWWHTVEQWDEVPPDEEDKLMQEDESKSFTILADKVHRGLRVFNKVFTERAELLWQYIMRLHALADNISEFHHKAKIAGRTGNTTTAVGGVAAIAGLAIAPFTFGISLIVTAVGVGVAAAGGITTASATISDNVNNKQDMKKVEVVLQDYEEHLLVINKVLHFINQGLLKLRGHPFLRSGTQHYSHDWEVRRAVQMISLVDSSVMRATEIGDATLASVRRLFTGMDRFFVRGGRELKKECKKELVGQIKEVANVLNDGIVELNAIREELQDATGEF